MEKGEMGCKAGCIWNGWRFLVSGIFLFPFCTFSFKAFLMNQSRTKYCTQVRKRNVYVIT